MSRRAWRREIAQAAGGGIRFSLLFELIQFPTRFAVGAHLFVPAIIGPIVQERVQLAPFTGRKLINGGLNLFDSAQLSDRNISHHKVNAGRVTALSARVSTSVPKAYDPGDTAYCSSAAPSQRPTCGWRRRARVERLKSAGASDHLITPIDVKKFLSMVKKTSARRRQSGRLDEAKNLSPGQVTG
jgi:hypothetical protein